MSQERIFSIGRFQIVLPADHKLDQYQQSWHMYDWILGEIAQLVATKYPDTTIIDIGANVGDSAALICRHRDIPVLCIEGNPQFFALLKRNLSRLPSCITAVQTLVGATAASLDAGSLVTSNGTASISVDTTTASSNAALTIQPLSEILRAHPQFSRPRMIKCDTDGSDFEVIVSSINVFSVRKPVIYFEYSMDHRKDSLLKSIEAIEALCGAGYCRFFVYDNFGNLMECVERDFADRFRDLNRLLMSHMLFGRQIYYYDICALSADDADLAEKLKNYHRTLLDSCITKVGWLV